MPQSIVVTGAASGIGLETVRQLLGRGERVIATARSERRCEELRLALDTEVETVVMDLSSIASVRAGATRIRELAPRLDVLVNNGGVFETKRRLGTDGHEMTWSVNVLAPFVLAEGLASALEAAPKARVVNLGSVLHERGRLDLADPEYAARRFSGNDAYAQSKLAVNLITREFARRHPRVAANAVHPGLIATNITRNLPAPLRFALGRALPNATMGAIPVVRLAVDASVDGTTGRYFHKTVERAPSAASLDDAAAVALYALLERTAAAG